MGICFSIENDQPQQPDVVMVERPQIHSQVESVLEPVPAHDQVKSKLRLSQIDPKTIPEVLFENEIIDVFVYDVHDGDTIHFLLDIGQKVPLKLALRMIGIDTPEIRAGKDKLPQEKIAATISRDYLKTLVSGHAKIRISEWDKFGSRVLGEVFVPTGESANSLMLKGGYAKPYHGEKKQPWTKEDLEAHPFNIKNF